MNFRLAQPAILIDLNNIAELFYVRAGDDGGLQIGAMTRQRTLERDPSIAAHAPLLHATMPHIAHTQIRNRGTIGGSLAHADPAAELPAVCLACDASLTIASRGGERTVPAVEFFQGFFTTALKPNEILVSIRFPAWPPGRRFAFLEFSRRHGDFALVGVALTVDGEDARVTVFGAEDVPKRIGVNRRNIAEVAARITPRADHHASAEYRKELVEVLSRRALEQALA